MNSKLTFVELVDLVAQSANTSKRVSELFLKELVAQVSQSLIEGEEVTVKGLGHFAVERRQRGGETTPQVTFTPDKALAETLNQPFAQFETITLDDEVTDEMLQALDDEPQDEPTEESLAVDEPDTESDEPVEEAPVEEPPVEDAPVEPPVMAAAVSSPVVQAPPEEPAPAPSEEAPASVAVDSSATRRAFIHGAVVGALSAFLISSLIALGMVLHNRPSGVSPSETTALQADTIAESDSVAPAPASKPVVVTDTISRTMFLSRMAVKHYGKPDFWVYIYEENKAKITDPNNVPIGTVMVIPPASKYGIDPADKASVDLARKRSFEVLSKH